MTKIDGVNFCAECLAEKHAPRERPARGPRKRSVIASAFAAAAFSTIAIAAAAIGVAMPFFALEGRLEANRQRLLELQLKLSSYQNDVGAYPAALEDLLSNDGTDGWSGPYTTARPHDGRPPIDPADGGKVLDVFGRPVLFYASPVVDEDELPERVYLASMGANGTWDTPGIETGNPPREPAGDDSLEWVAW